ncbi:methyltransferase, FkbM family [Bryocella elongata]|uniref:Methyltransferase, FkbM family n=1 Tax=Bryocella elongata TaxID=863522 RepID=A0A1H6ALP2_9BACT|nr:FkbM family methyltransferase [Bryocella elongata]SEG49094.1 methyltransferase, FkbM family [Bryocella elongata]
MKRTPMGRVAAVVNSGLERLGFTISKLPGRNTLARHLQEALREGRIECVIDVGAHHGEFGSLLRSLGYKGRIVSFEPSAEAYGCIGPVCAADGNWEVHRLCAGAFDGTAELLRFQAAEFNSLHAPSTFGEASWLSSHLEPGGTEAIAIRRLDTLLPELGIDAANTRLYLKIDTQGHDLQVLAGASGILPSVPQFQMELSALCLYEGTPNMEEVIASCRTLGFLPQAIHPVWSNGPERPILEWDCVFRRVAGRFLVSEQRPTSSQTTV